MGSGSKLDEPVSDDGFDPYTPGQLEDLSDDQLLDLQHNVNAILADRAERCKRLLAKIEPKKTRTRKKKVE